MSLVGLHYIQFDSISVSMIQLSVVVKREQSLLIVMPIYLVYAIKCRRYERNH